LEHFLKNQRNGEVLPFYEKKEPEEIENSLRLPTPSIFILVSDRWLQV
jgi:hypothetical protein